MKKLIDLDQTTLTKLKMLSVFEHLSVKALIENAVCTYVKNKEKERFDKLTNEEKEDLGLLMLMQEVDRTEFVSREEIVKTLQS
ncbi:hypothetical protein SL053_000498 [Flavobacterium psychrophilum]|jgi:hypothetical protein|uniref:CopG family transcriptional regulator n=2 Tax=Flavobacterium psychrophilum TaxID=96345 RepID=A6GYZ1_FLAPJ|nr:hypothetical protein [Flavobacterium psychrophilum]AIG30023.1 hypothetical protein IA03_05890 [Flavobacterium psychrophilum]AIG32299.1 hypothetical protein IA01_05885 [Flavobacterium psychrophilum]AIG34457.1 hypothetical protein IA02_05310 [Flavobacterium psychrophilum]AIG36817.1 hypothetical protein IA04_05795 [Flavobacterium psychrophilum]AIG39081.1 hypothetical protein IA05_05880 [Flavobacterium psychrophilum]